VGVAHRLDAPQYGPMTDDLKGKRIIITGANTGIGKTTAEVLARRGAELVLACRSKDKTTPVIDELIAKTGNKNISFVALDLANFASVRECAKELLSTDAKIDVLLNNAGLAGMGGITKDGFELAFGTNHLGHYLFTRLLLERIKANGTARIVNVASRAHYKFAGFDWEAVRKPTAHTTALYEYQVSKFANVLFTKELARRLEGTGVTAYSLHPGVVATDVWRQVPRPVAWLMKRFMLSPERGALSSLRCATDPALAKESGRYYDDDGREKEPNPLAHDTKLAKELWDKSAEWVGLEP
jgi:retinol dehydrogenase 12